MAVHVGVITIPAGTSRNNTSTAVPFALSAFLGGFRLLTTGTDVKYEFRPDNGNPSTFATTSALGMPLVANAQRDEDNPAPGGAPTVIAAWSTAGASIDVWSLP